MNKILIRALTVLASVIYQTRYIVNGTREEYIVAEEIFEDILMCCDMIKSKKLINNLSDSQVDCLLKLSDKILKYKFDSTMTASDMIFRDKHWNELRMASSDCLLLFGIDVKTLTISDINSMFT